MPTVFLKPNPEKKLEGKTIQVRDPIKGDWLPESGRAVNLSIYWLNRLRHGEVVRCEVADADTMEPTLAEKLDKMTKAELVAYAKTELNLELKKDSNKPALIDQIIAETDLHKPESNLDDMSIEELKQFEPEVK